MTTQAAEWEKLTARLKKLENENRRLKRVGLILLLLFGAGLLIANPRTGHAQQRKGVKDTMELDMLVVKTIAFLDEKEEVRLILSGPKKDKGASISFKDAKGIPRLLLGEEGLLLGDKNGVTRAALVQVNENRNASLDIADKEGKIIFTTNK